ncbi:MAG: hypothetical protein WBD31_04085 [Rubripirellula sp.]
MQVLPTGDEQTVHAAVIAVREGLCIRSVHSQHERLIHSATDHQLSLPASLKCNGKLAFWAFKLKNESVCGQEHSRAASQASHAPRLNGGQFGWGLCWLSRGIVLGFAISANL